MKKLFLPVIGGLIIIGLGYGGYRAGWWKMPIKLPEQRSVTVALKWLHQAQFAGNYVALEKGYYRDKGMAVNLVPYDLVRSPIDLVVSGSAEFGVTGADELLKARSLGIPVVAVAVIFQESPVVAYALKESGITAVRDFAGKRIGFENSDNVKMTIDNMIFKGGLDPRKAIARVPIGFDATSLINGEVEVATGYAINEPLMAAAAGHEVVIIRPSQYGIMDYADVLFTSEKMIAEQSELVKGYVQATLAGWEEAFLEPQEALEAVMKYSEDKNESARKHQEQMLAASEQLIKPGGSKSIGQMSYVRWHRLYEEMKAAKIITNEVDVRRAYDQNFLGK